MTKREVEMAGCWLTSSPANVSQNIGARPEISTQSKILAVSAHFFNLFVVNENSWALLTRRRVTVGH